MSSYYPNQGEDNDHWGGAGGDTSARGGSAQEPYGSNRGGREDAAYGRATSSRDLGYAAAAGGVGVGISYKKSPPAAVASLEKKRAPDNSDEKRSRRGGGAKTAAPAEPALEVPLPVEGRAVPPNVQPLEPPMPPPKVSKRFPMMHKRQPDLVLGKVVDSEKSQVRGEAHIVNCSECRCRMKVKKYAVVVRCPDCSRVSPASSTKLVKGH